MPEYLAPGVYIEEVSSGLRPIEGVSTSNAGLAGGTARGPMDVRLVTSFPVFERLYGGVIDTNISFPTFPVMGIDRKSVMSGKRDDGRVVLGRHRSNKKKSTTTTTK